MKKIYTFLGSQTYLRNSLVVFLGSIVANGAAYLYHLFVGRILGPVQYGELAALLSLFFILNVPSSVLQLVLVKYFSMLKARKSFGEAKYLLFAVTKKIAFLEGVGFILLLPFLPTIGRFLHIQSISYFIWLYLIFAFFLLGTVNGSLLQGFQKFTESTIYANIGMALRLLFGILFSFWGVGWTLLGNVISNVISYISVFIPIRFIFSYKTERLTISKKSLLGYSIPTFLATLGITLLYSQDVVLVKHFFSPLEAGIYSSLSVLGKIIYFASSSIGFVLFPVAAEQSQLGKKSHMIVLYSIGAVALLSAVLNTIYFFAPIFVVHLLFGKAFESAAPYLGYFGLFITFFSLSSLLISSSLAANKMFVWLFTILAALIQTLGIWFFHASLMTVIMINFYVSLGLFVILLLYFFYEKS